MAESTYYYPMTLLSISGLGVDFGANTILRDVTFTVAQGERWGIVGRNGAGKTTVFRVITGEIAPTVGAVARQPGLRIAMLDQHRDFGEAVTVWEAAAQAYREVIALEKSLHAQGERMAELGDRLTEADLDAVRPRSGALRARRRLRLSRQGGRGAPRARLRPGGRARRGCSRA